LKHRLTGWHIRRYAGNWRSRLLLSSSGRRGSPAHEHAAHLQKLPIASAPAPARQAQSRLKMLERLTAIEPVRARREWRFEFLEPLRLPERLLDADDMALGYGERRVLEHVQFAVRSGDRIGILGVNGAGKSTLVKAIAGELAPQAGELRRSQGLAIGYFAQHQLDQLRPTRHRSRICGGSPRRARRAARLLAITGSRAKWRPR
jgi:ATP-binding cassette subfamily F protein 3